MVIWLTEEEELAFPISEEIVEDSQCTWAKAWHAEREEMRRTRVFKSTLVNDVG